MFASAFFATHLYPTIRWLVPAYLLLGMSMGPISCARISYLVTLANKLTYVMTEEEEEYEQVTGDAKEHIVQKLSRGLQVGLHVAIRFLQDAKVIFWRRPRRISEWWSGTRLLGSSCITLTTRPWRGTLWRWCSRRTREATGSAAVSRVRSSKIPTVSDVSVDVIVRKSLTYLNSRRGGAEFYMDGRSVRGAVSDDSAAG